MLAVCDYCSSTLVRHDQAVEDIGKMAQLVQDRSPLQLGSEGRYNGVHFALVGRLQLRYERGVWNEWYLLFDDQRTAWLSEAGGEYVLTFQESTGEPLPLFEKLAPGQRLSLAGRAWTISDIEQAECVAGQGELPFRVGGGYLLPAVDLRSGKRFATLDYSESPPLLFVGEAVDFAGLKFTNLRDSGGLEMVSVDARVFRCPACGASLSARSLEIRAVGCASCGAVVSTTDDAIRLASAALAASDARYMPSIELGSRGSFDGESLEVIGFMVRRCQSDGVVYNWGEYVLIDALGACRWLVQEQGHWNLVDVLRDPPQWDESGFGAKIWRDQSFRHFSSTPEAEVAYVIGEFPWRVKRGDLTAVVDFVAPPLMLSRERSPNEITWSCGRYLTPVEVAAAFGLKEPLAVPVGVYANQPNPWQLRAKKVLRDFVWFLVAAVVLQVLALLVLGGHRVLRQEFDFSAYAAGEQRSADFELPHGASKLRVHNTTMGLDNAWIGLGMVLVNRDANAAWPAQREIAFYQGYDDGEHWSEGRRDDEVNFSSLPPGHYYLTVDPELAPEIMGGVHDSMVISTGGANWSNFVLLLLALLLMPGYALFRSIGFETARWAESDHAPSSADDEDES